MPGLISAFNPYTGLLSGSPCLLSAGQRHAFQHAVDLLQTGNIILFTVNIIHGRHLLQTGQGAIHLVRLTMSVKHIAALHILQIMIFQRMVKATNQRRIVLEIARHRLGIIRCRPGSLCDTGTVSALIVSTVWEGDVELHPAKPSTPATISNPILFIMSLHLC